MAEAWITLLCVACSIVVLGVLERVLNALASTVWYATIGFSEGESKFSFAALQLVTYTGSSWSRVLTSAANAVVAGVSGVASWLFLAAILIFVSGALFMAYEQYPLIARGVALQWNEGIGPQVHAIIILPLELLNALVGALIPIYNTLVWVVTRMIKEGVVVPLLKAPEVVVRSFGAAALFARSSGVSVSQFAISTFRACNTSTCVTDVGTRTLDVITPMSHVRDFVALWTDWVGSEVCGPIAAPMDIATAPIMDINTAKAVHNLVNAALWLVLEMPIVTEARCGWAWGSGLCLNPNRCIPLHKSTWIFCNGPWQ